jgi:NhaP-type Na+/H+ or K+/H+ antiporter
MESIVFLVVAIAIIGFGRETILTVVITTVLLSVVAHGITAYPGALWYARRLEREPRDMAEYAPVVEMPVRLPHR